jgi:hypothetical protein
VRYELGFIFQKTAFFIATAVKNLKSYTALLRPPQTTYDYQYILVPVVLLEPLELPNDPA